MQFSDARVSIRAKNKTSNYIVSKDKADVRKESPSYLGKLRSNFMGTEFIMYDDGTNPETIQDASMGALRTNIRQELGAVFYVGSVGLVATRLLTRVYAEIQHYGHSRSSQDGGARAHCFQQ